ncbi:MAG: aspartate aminotransferase family protein, partial [Hyphomicrobiaceae bacterium]
VVTDIRGYGLLAAIDVHMDGAPGRRGTALQKKLFWNGLHIKFTGDAGIIAPPLVADRGQLDELVAILRQTLEQETV